MNLKRYTKLFNYGYFLSKYEPKILKNLLDTTEDVDEINQPLKAGNKQYKKERVFSKIKGASRSIKGDKNKDKDRGK